VLIIVNSIQSICGNQINQLRYLRYQPKTQTINSLYLLIFSHKQQQHAHQLLQTAYFSIFMFKNNQN